MGADGCTWSRRDRSLHLGNGIDLARFTPALAGEERVRKLRAELGIGEDELVVGTVGRMVREKGYHELFHAARIVRARIPNARFLVVGAGRPGQAGRHHAPSGARAAREDVVFTGWREDVAELMAVMDVFVLPSWREGMPRSAIEAAASGLPLVLTDIRGCREVVARRRRGLAGAGARPGRAGRRDPAALEDSALRRRMGAAARRRAEDKFDEDRVARVVVGATRLLLSSSRGER